MSVASPCTGICKLDPVTGWCLGCARSGEEMNGWASRPDAWRQAIWDLIPDRLQQLGVTCRRLPWSTQELRAFVVAALGAGQGSCVMGVPGGLAEFSQPPGGSVQIRCEGEAVICEVPNAAIHLRITDEVRALTFDAPGAAHPPRIVLAARRDLGRLPVSHGVTDLGTDAGALMPEPDTRLVDLGLGRREARFCLRMEQAAAAKLLAQCGGLPLAEALPLVGEDLKGASPTRVVETPLGRIEVRGPIGAPALGQGPLTHLQPDELATGRALPVGMELPRAYLPGAMFHGAFAF